MGIRLYLNVLIVWKRHHGLYDTYIWYNMNNVVRTSTTLKQRRVFTGSLSSYVSYFKKARNIWDQLPCYYSAGQRATETGKGQLEQSSEQLIVAAKKGDLALVKRLLESHVFAVSPNVSAKTGFSPVMAAAVRNILFYLCSLCF